MIISKAPLRISLFGGGTDIPEWFNQKNQKGYVFGGAINQYVYVYGLPQPKFEKTKFKR
jgi:D-glycero-alpha-D-manno-heptose-7-phosphate kinase